MKEQELGTHNMKGDSLAKKYHYWLAASLISKKFLTNRTDLI